MPIAELKFMRRLELNTGTITVVRNPDIPISVRGYFKAIDALNQDAHVYGCVYLATDLALAFMSDELLDNAKEQTASSANQEKSGG